MPFLFILIGALVVLIILMFFGHVEIIKKLQAEIKDLNAANDDLEARLIEAHEDVSIQRNQVGILKRRVEKLSTPFDPLI